MHYRKLHPATGCNPRRAFTLIELLVTISIITILIGILSPVALKMLANADVSRTRSTLLALNAALDEYKLATGDVPDHKLVPGATGVTTNAITNLVVGDDPDDSTDNDDDTTIGLYLSRIAQLGGTADSMMRAAVGRQGLIWDENDDGVFASEEKNPPPFQSIDTSDPTEIQNYLDVENWTLTDPWDGKLRYAARISHDDNFDDDDYLPAHPTPFFASAGPDGEFGDANLLAQREAGDSLTDDELEQAALAEDNIYSFDID